MAQEKSTRSNLTWDKLTQVKFDLGQVDTGQVLKGQVGYGLLSSCFPSNKQIESNILTIEKEQLAKLVILEIAVVSVSKLYAVQRHIYVANEISTLILIKPC
mgnify:FL=1